MPGKKRRSWENPEITTWEEDCDWYKDPSAGDGRCAPMPTATTGSGVCLPTTGPCRPHCFPPCDPVCRPKSPVCQPTLGPCRPHCFPPCNPVCRPKCFPFTKP